MKKRRDKTEDQVEEMFRLVKKVARDEANRVVRRAFERKETLIGFMVDPSYEDDE